MSNQTNNTSGNKVLVVGGGVGGIRTVLDLAEAGHDVVLVDSARSIGGLMTQLDRTFPTNNCDLCTLSPHLSESGRQLHIELRTMTRVTGLTGERGDFTVTTNTAPRYIDTERCTACGECYNKFPECVRFTPGLDHRAPTCMRYPQAIPQAFSIDMEACTDVQALVDVCPANAIVPDDTEKVETIRCGSIVLAPGAQVFDPTGLDYLAYSEQPDVVTSLEYERILSASGPTFGQLVRPSDGRQPKKIAWIQCVGSRGIQRGAESHCSSACCMFALKEAMVTKERFQEDIETTIFYMDMRTSGKNYELYYQDARDRFGVQFVRCRPHSVVRRRDSEQLEVHYVPDGELRQTAEAFDMVVLSTGFKVGEEIRETARIMGIETDVHGFAVTDPFTPVSTTKPGIYVAGLFESPKDIPETMVQASAAACMAAGDLSGGGSSVDDPEELPPERDVSAEEPKVGVFLCDCGENIGGVLDVSDLAGYAKTIAGVAVAEGVGHGCSRESMERITKTVRDQGLNRVVIGGCSPRTHEKRFQDAIRKAGLNPYLLEMANIRDQITWVHADDPAKASEKARSLVRMAVGAAKKARPLTDKTLPMNKNVLVVGGGVSGMTTALELAGHGHKVYLAERDAKLGGNATKVRRTLEGADVQPFVNELVEMVHAAENITVITNAIIVDHSGVPGMFRTGMQVGPQMFYRQIEHGVTVLATGAVANRPAEYLLGESDAVVDQLEMDALLEDEPDRVASWSNVVMIQCVGSRCPENPNCSRICCQAAVKNALRIRELNPEARVFVLYRDMRTYGLQEDYYQKAREQGVVFVRYEPEAPPRVEKAAEGVLVRFHDPVLGRDLEVDTDCLCLSTGMVADDEATEDLSVIFKLPRTADGFFLEDHVKLRPVDLPIPGFFVAGTAHSPKSIRESLAQAKAAASRARTMLASDVISTGAAVARVEGEKCAACLICVRACPFGVPFINAEGYSEIDPSRCRGCGVCAAACPAKAIQLMQFEDDMILAKLESLFERMVA
ncbi:MAG: FAD-dependent oxidoreductase [Desulfatibacillaceae bacterium]